MVIVFWDSQGVFLIHYIPKGVNVNSVCHCKVLCKLKGDILYELKADVNCKWSDLRNEQIFFVDDNAYSSEFMVAFIDKLTSLVCLFSRICSIHTI